MEQNNTTATEEKEESMSDFTRSRNDRMIAGVASALAERFNVAPWVMRAIFIVLSFAGGLGIAIYGAIWFLTRNEDEDSTPAEGFFANTQGRSWIGIGLIFLAALLILDGVFSSGVVWATGLLVVGVLLYTGDLPGLSSGSDSKEGVQQVTSELVEEEANTGETEAANTGGPVVKERRVKTPPKPRKPKERSILGRLTIGVMLLGTGILALFDATTDLVNPAPRHYVALATVILGLGLVVGGFMGRARGLILLGVLMVPLLLASPLFDFDFNSRSFSLDAQPLAFSELRTGYETDFGEMDLDLRSLPWDGQTITITADLGVGEMSILVPENVAVVGHAEVGIGEVEVRTHGDSDTSRRSSGGFGAELDLNEPGEDGVLEISADVGIGHLQVVRTAVDRSQS